jgi:hypothetical protein
VQVDLSRRERGQAPGALGRAVVEKVSVVEVQLEQDLGIVVAGPQSLEIPLDLDQGRGQRMCGRCVGEMLGQL